LKKIINKLKSQKFYKNNIVHIEIIPPKEPKYETTNELSPELMKYLIEKDIRLYTHQVEAIHNILKGENVFITTSTGSGKTLIFTLAIIESLIENEDNKTLILYPTKALSNDQLNSFNIFNEFFEKLNYKLNSNIFDGDTSKSEKRIKMTNIFLSNPYAFHEYLQFHSKWKSLFQNLKYIVIDEAHQYRGIFGSNVAMLIRRILRLCERYGSNPKFILCSATMSNSLEFAKKLTSQDFVVIDNDGSGKTRKYFVLWNTIKSAENKLTIQLRNLVLFFMLNKIQSLCFTGSRKTTELVSMFVKKLIKSNKPDLIDKISPYRAGYLPNLRRKIESKFRNNELLALISTNALELGIDIGNLDAVILGGYPGSIISLWQQAGRAGRRDKDAIIIFCGREDPLEQYLINHPEELFGKSPENAIISIKNPYILIGHILCAAKEKILRTDEIKRYFGDLGQEIIESLVEEKIIEKTSRGYIFFGNKRSSELIGLNNISTNTFKILCDGILLEIIDESLLYREAFPHAVFLHEGNTFIVDNIDFENEIVYVHKENIDYYTTALSTTTINILDTYSTKNINSIKITFGEVQVIKLYDRYKIEKYGNTIAYGELYLPELEFETDALWFEIPETILNRISEEDMDIAGGLHALEHALIALSPLIAMCDRWDIGGMSTSSHADTQTATIFIYDGYPGGIGISEKLYEEFWSLFEKTQKLINECSCQSGCPSCIFSPKCGNDNQPLDKRCALFIINEIIKLKNDLK